MTITDRARPPLSGGPNPRPLLPAQAVALLAGSGADVSQGSVLPLAVAAAQGDEAVGARTAPPDTHPSLPS